MKTTDINKIKFGFYTYEEWGNIESIFICKYDDEGSSIFYEKDGDDEYYYIDKPMRQKSWSHTLGFLKKHTKLDSSIKVTGYSTKEELIADHPEIFFR